MSPFVQLKVLFIGVNESSRQELFNHAICFKKFQNISRVVIEELKSKNIPLFEFTDHFRHAETCTMYQIDVRSNGVMCNNNLTRKRTCTNAYDCGKDTKYL